MQHEALHVEALRLLVDGVLPRAGDDISTATDHGLERLRAAFEIADLDVEAFVLEIAESLRDRQWQIVEPGLAADGDADLSLLGFALRLDAKGQCHSNDSAGGDDQIAKTLHRFLQ